MLFPSFSDERFNLLFRALDGPDGDGQIQVESLQQFVFPGSQRIVEEESEDGAAEETYELPPV
jgi:hypothetical protein